MVWALDRNTFRITMAKEIEREGKETASWLANVPILDQLRTEEISQVSGWVLF